MNAEQRGGSAVCGACVNRRRSRRWQTWRRAGSRSPGSSSRAPSAEACATRSRTDPPSCWTAQLSGRPVWLLLGSVSL